MRLYHSMIIMFIASFIIQYFLMPPIMVNKYAYVYNHLAKVYMSLIMAFLMVLIEIGMHDHQYHTFSLKLYAPLVLLIFSGVYLYRQQYAINDKEYLSGMIEHHSMGIFTSEEILKKTNDFNVAKIAKNIIQTQNDEIREMQQILEKK